MASIFTTGELADLHIEHFIFHLITKEGDKPRYLDQIELAAEQAAFFKEQFRLAAGRSTEYLFSDPEHASVVADIRELVERPVERFLPQSKRLATSFHSYHRGNVNDGIFIIALVALPAGKRLLFLIKMDYEQVLDFELESIGDATVRAILHEVTNPIVQSREAIQKMAIVDIDGHYRWDVLAHDRATGSRPEVSQYFADFLQMRKLETDADWMNKTVSATLDWARRNRKELSQLPGDYKEKAVEYMETRPVFAPDDFIETVLTEEPPEQSTPLKASFSNFLDHRGIAAAHFTPDLEALDEKRSRLVTQEGVVVEWKGTQERNFIEIRSPAQSADGLYHIVIRTENIDFKR